MSGPRRSDNPGSNEPGSNDSKQDELGPQLLGASLDRLVRQLGWGPRTSAVGVIADWDNIVGPAISAHARAVASEGATLVVAVDDPAWATQLRWLEADLLQRLCEHTGVKFERLTIKVRPR